MLAQKDKHTNHKAKHHNHVAKSSKLAPILATHKDKGKKSVQTCHHQEQSNPS